MKRLCAIVVLGLSVSSLIADIQIPPRPGPVRKFSRAVAKLAYSPTYVLDSLYDKTQNEGGTSGFTFGLIDGTAKTLVSTGYGLAELFTFAIPPYEPFNANYDMPPADLNNFW